MLRFFSLMFVACVGVTAPNPTNNAEIRRAGTQQLLDNMKHIPRQTGRSSAAARYQLTQAPMTTADTLAKGYKSNPYKIISNYIVTMGCFDFSQPKKQNG